MALAPFPVDTERTAIAIAYRNRHYIGREVLPPFSVGLQSFTYLRHDKRDAFQVPDARIGRKGEANEVEFSASEQSATCFDFALRDQVPKADIDNAPPNYDPLNRATIGLTELIELGREKRVADIVQNAANYADGCKSTLSGSAQWSDTTSDPVAAITEAIDGMIVRPNVLVLGRPVFSALKVHPKVVRAVRKLTEDGVVTAEQIAELFELDKVLVGDGFYSSAGKGRTLTLSRLWGKNAALLCVDPALAGASEPRSFGATAEYGTRLVHTNALDPGHCGLRGGTEVVVGESTCELVMAPDLGYLFSAAVA